MFSRLINVGFIPRILDGCSFCCLHIDLLHWVHPNGFYLGGVRCQCRHSYQSIVPMSGRERATDYLMTSWSYRLKSYGMPQILWCMILVEWGQDISVSCLYYSCYFVVFFLSYYTIRVFAYKIIKKYLKKWDFSYKKSSLFFKSGVGYVSLLLWKHIFNYL